MIDGKELLDLITGRQSDRKYSEKEIEKEKLERIIEAGRMAPSACNAQPWKFIVVNDRKILTGLARASAGLGMNGFLDQAPVHIVVVRERPNLSSSLGGAIKRKEYSLVDIGIAVAHMCIQAEAEGLGSCIIGWFDEPEVRRILGIPRAKRVELIITLGYSEAHQRQKVRKPHEETVSFNKYSPGA